LQTLQKFLVMQRATGWSTTAARSFVRMAQFPRFIFARKLGPQTWSTTFTRTLYWKPLPATTSFNKKTKSD
jgi:hypothetical protein